MSQIKEYDLVAIDRNLSAIHKETKQPILLRKGKNYSNLSTRESWWNWVLWMVSKFQRSPLNRNQKNN